MKIVIVTPVWGRTNFSPNVIASWPRDSTWSTLVVYSEPEERTQYSWFAETLLKPNQPLCGKFSAGVKHAFAHMGATHVCIMGSDTLAAPAMWEELAFAAASVDYVGVRDIWVADAIIAYHWPGYENHRKGEPVGPGRVFSRALAEKHDFTVYDEHRFRSCDGTMTARFGLPEVLLEGRDHAFVSLKDNQSVTPLRAYKAISFKSKIPTLDFFRKWYRDLVHIIPFLGRGTRDDSEERADNEGRR